MSSIATRAWQTARRLLGYLRSDEDVRAVYGDHPHGDRAQGDVTGNAAGNVAGTIGGGFGQ